MKSSFNKSSSPLYSQLADVLRERISNDYWPLNAQIPTLQEISKEFDMALVTVRMAVQLLKNEGLLTPEQGRGTFVSKKPPIHPNMRIESSLKELAQIYNQSPPKLIPVFEENKSPVITNSDGILAPSYRHLRRLHSTNEQINSVISAYLDERVYKLAPKRFKKELIIPVLMSLEHLSIGSAKQILTISAAGIDTSKDLNVALNAPIGKLRRIICDKNGVVIYVGDLTYRGDFIRLEMNLLS